MAVSIWLIVFLTPHLATSEDPFALLGLVTPYQVQAARDFVVPTPDGGPIRLADYRGNVVLLNFWATWCLPSKEEMPAMERLYQRFRDRGLVILAISVDAEGAAVVAPFIKQHKLTYPIGLDPDRTLAAQYAAWALPSSFFVDKAGNLVALAAGPREWDSAVTHAVIEFLLRKG